MKKKCGSFLVGQRVLLSAIAMFLIIAPAHASQDAVPAAAPGLTGYAMLIQRDGITFVQNPGNWTAEKVSVAGNYIVRDGNANEDLTRCAVLITPQVLPAPTVEAGATQGLVRPTYEQRGQDQEMHTYFYVELFNEKGAGIDSAFSLVAGIGC